MPFFFVSYIHPNIESISVVPFVNPSPVHLAIEKFSFINCISKSQCSLPMQLIVWKLALVNTSVYKNASALLSLSIFKFSSKCAAIHEPLFSFTMPYIVFHVSLVVITICFEISTVAMGFSLFKFTSKLSFVRINLLALTFRVAIFKLTHVDNAVCKVSLSASMWQ